MTTLVRRWGNSLAFRIPKTFADEIPVREGDAVEMSLTKGRLVISTRPRRRYHLADLVADIRPNHLHKEIAVGRPQGREVW